MGSNLAAVDNIPFPDGLSSSESATWGGSYCYAILSGSTKPNAIAEANRHLAERRAFIRREAIEGQNARD